MGLKATKQKRYTPEQYLALEDKAEFRSEYLDGFIFEMSGGAENHNNITLNIAGELKAKLRGKCRTHAIDVKVWVNAWNSFVYPDIFVICGESIYHKNRQDILTNPTIIVEVLSKSTEANDRGEKFIAYRTLESLQEYILVSQNKCLVEKFTRQNDGSWKFLATIGIESEVEFESVNITLSMSEIYDLVEFE